MVPVSVLEGRDGKINYGADHLRACIGNWKISGSGRTPPQGSCAAQIATNQRALGKRLINIGEAIFARSSWVRCCVLSS
jgi:hypothetical protein